MRRRRESRPAVRKLIDIHFCPVLPPTCLFLSFPSSLSPAFLLFLLASLVTYIYRGSALPTAARQPRLPATAAATTNSGSSRRTAPRRETRHNRRNKWRSFIPAVVIIKWWMPQSSLRSISNDYARLNGSDYGHRTGSPERRKGRSSGRARARVLARIKRR